jgi:hypothetical protein
MSRISASACGLVVAAAVVVGCGPAKQLPDVVPTQRGPSQKAPDPFGPAPAQSDPAAKAALDRAVSAITAGDPKRLGKAKVSRATLQGFIELPGKTEAGEPLRREATRNVEAVWPDRARVEVVFKETGTMTFRMRGPHGWARHGLVEQNLDPITTGHIMRVDMNAQHWLFLGLPLADPKAVAFDLKKGTPAGPETTSLKVALPDMPVLLVTLDEKGLPVRVEYHPFESNQRQHKVVALSGHKPVEGLTLPTKLELTQNEVPAERWSEVKWEFPDKIAEDRFDPPK